VPFDIRYSQLPFQRILNRNPLSKLHFCTTQVHRRDAENAEDSQRVEIRPTLALSSIVSFR
jgi:hypothetical protein